MKDDFLKSLYDSICEQYNVLEKEYLKNPSLEKKNVLVFLRFGAYEIDKKLQER